MIGLSVQAAVTVTGDGLTDWHSSQAGWYYMLAAEAVIGCASSPGLPSLNPADAPPKNLFPRVDPKRQARRARRRPDLKGRGGRFRAPGRNRGALGGREAREGRRVVGQGDGLRTASSPSVLLGLLDLQSHVDTSRTRGVASRTHKEGSATRRRKVHPKYHFSDESDPSQPRPTTNRPTTSLRAASLCDELGAAPTGTGLRRGRVLLGGRGRVVLALLGRGRRGGVLVGLLLSRLVLLLLGLIIRDVFVLL